MGASAIAPRVVDLTSVLFALTPSVHEFKKGVSYSFPGL